MRKRVIAGLLAGAVALGGALVFASLRSTSPRGSSSPRSAEASSSSGPSPSPVMLVSPTAAASTTASPDVSASPTPDSRPWYERLPANPYQGMTVNAIPLHKDVNGYESGGTLVMESLPFRPYYGVRVYAATIVAVEADAKAGIAWVELATARPGTIVTRDRCQLTNVNGEADVYLCSYSGPTIWLIVNRLTFVYNSSATQRYGRGLEVAAPFLGVGETVRTDFLLGEPPDRSQPQSAIDRNVSSWRNLRNSVGKPITRTSAPNLRYAFYAADLFVWADR